MTAVNIPEWIKPGVDVYWQTQSSNKALQKEIKATVFKLFDDCVRIYVDADMKRIYKNVAPTNLTRRDQ